MLTGGASRRMGRDKAFLDLHGRPLAAVARDALLRAGAVEVLAVGGDGPRLAGLGLQPVADEHPGEGPLGGILTGLGAARSELVVVLACDLVAVAPALVRRLLRELDTGGDVAVPVAEGRRHVLAAAWRSSCAPALAAAFAAGERAPRRALDELRVVEVRGVTAEELADVDSPEDLARYARRPEGSPGPEER